MKVCAACFWTTLLVLGMLTPAAAGGLTDKVKVETGRAVLESGMEPGTYVCALGHLHITGTVQNLTGMPLGRVTVAGKAFGAEGKVLGTATASIGQATLGPNEKATVNLEFLSVTGPLVQQVKTYRVTVVDAPPANPCAAKKAYR